jgi:hypothetical protein
MYVFRTQHRNKELCIARLKDIINEAAIEPKDREIWEGIGDKGHRIRKNMKDRRSEVKQSRGKNRNDDD